MSLLYQVCEIEMPITFFLPHSLSCVDIQHRHVAVFPYAALVGTETQEAKRSPTSLTLGSASTRQVLLLFNSFIGMQVDQLKRKRILLGAVFPEQIFQNIPIYDAEMQINQTCAPPIQAATHVYQFYLVIQYCSMAQFLLLQDPLCFLCMECLERSSSMCCCGANQR